MGHIMEELKGKALRKDVLRRGCGNIAMGGCEWKERSREYAVGGCEWKLQERTAGKLLWEAVNGGCKEGLRGYCCGKTANEDWKEWLRENSCEDAVD